MSHKPKVAKLDGMAKLPHPTVPKEAYIEPLITEKKKFYQIRHAVLELSLIEKLLTGVFWRKNNFSEIFWVN